MKLSIKYSLGAVENHKFKTEGEELCQTAVYRFVLKPKDSLYWSIPSQIHTNELVKYEKL